MKKQSTSPSSKYGTPANSVPSSPFVARRLKVNQSPAPSAASEVILYFNVCRTYMLVFYVVLHLRIEMLRQYFLSRSKQVLSIVRLHQPLSSQDFTRFHQTLQMMKAVSQPLNYLHRLVQPQREIKPRQKEVVLAMVSKILFKFRSNSSSWNNHLLSIHLFDSSSRQ